MRPAAARDAGFTLIELLIVVVILGLITVPLANAMIGYLRNSDAASARMALSHDAQISAAYVARDVAPVGIRDLTAAPNSDGSIPFQPSIQTNAAYNEGGHVCGGAATPVAAVRLLADDWDAASHDHGYRVVAYYLASRELHRLLCAGGTATDVVIAHNVDPGTLSVTCGSPSTCDGTAVPRTVTLAFSVTLPRAGTYPITLTGERRQL